MSEDTTPASDDLEAEAEDSEVEVAAEASPPASAERARGRLARAKLPLLVYLVCAAVYVGTLGPRALAPSPDNHYVHLANSWLHGRLDQIGGAPGTNDWACYDSVEHGPCPNNRWSFPGQEDRYRFYVSFPPLPAVIALPAVAVFGLGLWDRLFWALLAGFAPMLLFVLLRRLRESGRSGRSLREDLLLTTLFAFGSVFYFVAVQGTVWFSAQVVASALLMLYLLFGLDARRPVLAGLMLGLCFMARPTTLLLSLFFGVEALRMSRLDGAPTAAPEASWQRRLWVWLRGVEWRPVFKNVALFSAPILAVGLVAMWHNAARFDSPLEFGHTYLQIRWRPRIELWGLFNYHYLGKNLAVFLADLPWLSKAAPYVKISRHGLALWFTTPALLLTLWPKRVTPTIIACWVGLLPVALLDLCYQNSGWIQFGYRFALDYLPLLFLLLALGRRRFGWGFGALLAFAIVVNTFGAITFDRAGQFYDDDGTQTVIFQPD
ncbi:MAG: hypothetical protein GXP55_08845 [Deltaproteobacteria bacterium]|nr:hypothetical protein [Deltaproteobacteria bacterium]